MNPALALLLLPFGAWLCLAGVGAASPGPWAAEPAVRASLLSIGMMFSALGLWTAPLALLRLSARRRLSARLFARVILLWPSLAIVFLGFSAAAVRASWPTLGLDLAPRRWLAVGLLAMALSGGAMCAAAVWIAATRQLRRLRFGAVSLAARAEGGVVRGELRAGKPARDVRARLERVDGEAGSLAGAVVGLEELPRGGWLYRLEAPAPPQGSGSWALVAELTSVDGARTTEVSGL